ncbi:hypothetical protein D515_01460 [Grimontia indica]|uniref:Uncharacterized protein n=5 Tax=Grimontia TaxID=246861 RepID=A0A128F741_9GAMM|nr:MULTISPECIES: hypothetical protein [Grimontia]EOD79666.1 hypothetical protein D515_01460 [Grimontia indica]NGN96304.1 hypothetical protein [Grimontia sedimenti]USH05423.1 hypothetical protein K6Q96_19665 [Grimontia kaedaensis]WRW00240.1 hypothetical protein VP504_25005 [Grimontia sp. NTOU-MAR1]CZF81785.1 hypothetical protein GCE9029_02826 [Grimontia celer]
MDEQRAINLYYFLRSQNAPQSQINEVVERINQSYGINLRSLDTQYRKQRGYSPNRYDINTYGTAGSRTMNQTRQMQKPAH